MNRSVSSKSSRRRKKTLRNKETWLNNKIILGIRKMKLVGLKQALKPGVLWMERLLWIMVFLFCVGYTIYLTVSTVTEYSEKPVANSGIDDEPIFKIPFPATTITGTMILRNNAINDIEELYNEAYMSKTATFQYEGYTWSTRLVDVLVFTIDHLCQLANSFGAQTKILDERKIELFNLAEFEGWVETSNITLRDNKNDAELRDTVVPFLKKKTLDCSKILAACIWEGHEDNCAELFVPIQTDVGNGCSFNRIPEQLLRKQHGLISIFNNHTFKKTEVEEWGRFKLDSRISVKGLADFFDFTYPRTQHHAGKLSGLSFLLIFDQNIKGMSCPIVDSYGYLIGIHSPFEDPRIMQTAITVPPSMEVFVKVKAEVTVADKQIKNLSIEKRKCYFQFENPLKRFEKYTVGNCQQECLGRLIEKECKCSLLTLSVGENEILCGPKQGKGKCAKRAKTRLENGGYEKLCRNPVCFPPCTEIKYDADVSYLPYYPQGIFDFTSRSQLSNDSVTSLVHVAYGSNFVPTRERKLQFGFSVLFGVIGGTWGMTLEFSLFTIFNIVAGIAAILTPTCLEIDHENQDEEATSNNGSPSNTSLDNTQGPNGSEINPTEAIPQQENLCDQQDLSSDSREEVSTANSDSSESSSTESDSVNSETSVAERNEADRTCQSSSNEVTAPMLAISPNNTTEANNLGINCNLESQSQDIMDLDELINELLKLTSEL